MMFIKNMLLGTNKKLKNWRNKMSRLFREMHDKWENEPESLTSEEQLERAEFNKQVAEDEYREAKQNVLNRTKNANINN